VRAYFAVGVARGAARFGRAVPACFLNAQVQPGCESRMALSELVSFRSKLGEHFVGVHYS
jgi:hypothetical protein